MKRKLVGVVYRNIIKPFLFKREPEDAHKIFLNLSSIVGKYALLRAIMGFFFNFKSNFLKQNIDGIDYINPVGLAAGFDKDAGMIKVLPKVGFGFLQIGSITFGPYEGNKGKRAVRLLKSRGIIVNYGLKNDGIKKVAPKIPKKGLGDIPISISIARTNCPETSSLEKGAEDYIKSIKYVEEQNIGDFYTINVSCPNTEFGEPFTTAENLEILLSAMEPLEITKPVYLKMPIDKTWEEFNEMLKVANNYNVSGLIIGNLLKDRNNKAILDPIAKDQKGGISGKPTEKATNKLIFKTYEQYGKRFTIVGTGGIFSAEDAYLKIKLGASLVQLITGMIFRGPQVVGEINKGLVRLAKKDGYKNISEAIGSFHDESTVNQVIAKKEKKETKEYAVIMS